MNQYVKPIISIASGITEGIYTASGVTPNAVTLGALKVLNDWGTNEIGRASCRERVY